MSDKQILDALAAVTKELAKLNERMGALETGLAKTAKQDAVERLTQRMEKVEIAAYSAIPMPSNGLADVQPTRLDGSRRLYPSDPYEGNGQY